MSSQSSNGLTPVRRRRRIQSSAELRLLLLATVAVATARVALWVLPSRAILRVVRSLRSTTEQDRGARRPAVERIVWAIDAAARRIPGATCLTQAIAGQILLRRYGYASRVRIGVRHDETGSFRAHAWIERDGRILIGGSGSRRFTPLDIPGATHIRQMVTR